MSSSSCFPHYCSQSPHLCPCWWELMPISSWRMEVLSKQPKCWRNLGSKSSFLFSLYTVHVRYNILYFKRLVGCFLFKKIFKNPRFIIEWEHYLRFSWSMQKFNYLWDFILSGKSRMIPGYWPSWSLPTPNLIQKKLNCILRFLVQVPIYLLYSELVS